MKSIDPHCSFAQQKKLASFLGGMTKPTNVEEKIDIHRKKPWFYNRVNTQHARAILRARNRWIKQRPNGSPPRWLKRVSKTPNTTSFERLGMHHMLASCISKSVASPRLQNCADCSLPCLALPHELTASSVFWKELMIECRDKKGSWGSMVFLMTSGLTL